MSHPFSRHVGNEGRRLLLKRDPAPGLIFHSYRSIHYASHLVRKILDARRICPIMSGKEDCFDIAMMESFCNSLNKELARFEIFHSKDKALRSVNYRYLLQSATEVFSIELSNAFGVLS